jgi:hypothetical protein
MADPSLLEHVPERAKDFAAVGGIGTWLYLAAKTMLRNDKRQGETDRRRDDADKLTGETYQQTIELLKGEVTRLGEEVQRLVSDVRNYRDQCFDCKLWQEARKLRDGESTDQPSEEPHV